MERGIWAPTEGKSSIDLNAPILKQWGTEREGEEKVYLYIRYNTSTGIWKGVGMGIGQQDMSICESTLPCVPFLLRVHFSSPPSIISTVALSVAVVLVTVTLCIALTGACMAIARASRELTHNVIVPIT